MIPAQQDKRLARLRERLPNLLEESYRAALEPDRWPALLSEAVALSDSRSARMLVLNDAADTVHASIKHNIDDGYHRQYVEYYVNKCPWRPELKHKPTGQLYSTFLDFSCKQPNYYRTEFYNDWAGPQDIAHGMCGTIYQAPDLKVQLLIQRTADAGHYDRPELAFFNTEIVPHFRRALEINRRFYRDRAQQNAALKAAQSGLPYLLLDRDLNLVHANGSAEELLRRGTLLQLQNHRPQAVDAGTDAELQSVLRRTAAAAHGQWQAAGGDVQCRGRGPRKARLLVSPIFASEAALAFPGDGLHIAVLIHDPETRPRLDHAALMGLFGLTPAEAVLANLLAEGLSPEQAAEYQTLSMHTVRSRIKTIFGKTHTHRQAELVSLLLRSVPAPDGPPPRLNRSR